MSADHTEPVIDPKRLVPSYLRTQGRTEAKHQLDLLTVVRSTGRRDPREFDFDHAEVLIRCHATSLSVIELSGHMREPCQIIKVLVSDLITEGAVEAVAPQDYSCGVTVDQLKIILAGLEAKL